MEKDDYRNHGDLISEKDVVNAFLGWLKERFIYGGIIAFALLCYFSH